MTSRNPSGKSPINVRQVAIKCIGNYSSHMCTNSTLLNTTLEPPTINNITDTATGRAASNLRSQHMKLKGLYSMILRAHSTKYVDATLTSGFPPRTVTNTVVWHTVSVTSKVASVHAMKTNVVLMGIWVGGGGGGVASNRSLLISALDGGECLAPCQATVTLGEGQSTRFGRVQDFN